MWPVLSNEWTEDLWNATNFHRYNVNFFIDTDMKNTSRRILFVSLPFLQVLDRFLCNEYFIPEQIGEGNIGLSRDMLLNGLNDKIVRKYHEFMVNVSVYFGANKTQAENEFEKVVMFEMELANVSQLLKINYYFLLLIYSLKQSCIDINAERRDERFK